MVLHRDILAVDLDSRLGQGLVRQPNPARTKHYRVSHPGPPLSVIITVVLLAGLCEQIDRHPMGAEYSCYVGCGGLSPMKHHYELDSRKVFTWFDSMLPSIGCLSER